MAKWTILKSAIADAIKNNGNQEITGQVLQNVLNSIVSSVGENATFAGVATPTTNPGVPDGPVFYIASEEGTYSNFGGIELENGLHILSFSENIWSKKTILTLVHELGDSQTAAMSQQGVTNAMINNVNIVTVEGNASSNQDNRLYCKIKKGNKIKLMLTSDDGGTFTGGIVWGYVNSSGQNVLNQISSSGIDKYTSEYTMPEDAQAILSYISSGNVQSGTAFIRMLVFGEISVDTINSDVNLLKSTFSEISKGGSNVLVGNDYELLEQSSSSIYLYTTVIKKGTKIRVKLSSDDATVNDPIVFGYKGVNGEVYNNITRVTLNNYSGVITLAVDSDIFLFWLNNSQVATSGHAHIEMEIVPFNQDSIDELQYSVDTINSGLYSNILTLVEGSASTGRSLAQKKDINLKAGTIIRFRTRFLGETDKALPLIIYGFTNTDGEYIQFVREAAVNSFTYWYKLPYDTKSVANWSQTALNESGVYVFELQIYGEFDIINENLFKDEIVSSVYQLKNTASEASLFLSKYIRSNTKVKIGVFSEDGGEVNAFVFGYYNDNSEKVFNQFNVGLNKYSEYVFKQNCITAVFWTNSIKTDGSFQIRCIIEELNYSEEVNQDGDFPNLRSAKIFMRVGCIGDSYTSGHIDLDSDDASPTNLDFSWPKYMEQLTGNVWSNWAQSGSTAKQWVQGYSNLSKVQEEGNKCQAYVIGLMINDQGNWSSYATPVGDIDDIGTDADTYYAWYYKLVQEVIKVNSDAKIFCNTCPTYSKDYSYNQAVRDIVQYCQDRNQNVFLCDLAGDEYNNVNFYKNPTFLQDAVGGHFTAIGYEFMAECYLRVISDVVNSNIKKFQDVYKIPYDKLSV